MISWLIHIFAHGIILFSEWLSNILLCIYTPHLYPFHIFIRSSINAHLCCFYVLAFVNSVAMNIGVDGRFQIVVLKRSALDKGLP